MEYCMGPNVQLIWEHRTIYNSNFKIVISVKILLNSYLTTNFNEKNRKEHREFKFSPVRCHFVIPGLVLPTQSTGKTQGWRFIYSS